MSKKFVITTPIYYPSAKLHIGHAYCTTVTDTIARYKRLKGYDVFFITGSDEHGQKIETNAAAEGKSPQAFVDEIVLGFYNLWDKLHITNDTFVRTTDRYHTKAVANIFSKLLANGDIYLGNYEGWYCKHEETFWTNTQVGDDHLCPVCNRPVEKAVEESYFFKTSKYVDKLLKYYQDNPKFITPTSRLNEMINTFIKPGLDDLAVSRTSFKWGIPVNENEKHVIYVWLDALTNYITGLGYCSEDDSNFKKFWEDEDTEIVHIMGADITRFHAIYWPMFLFALDLRLPTREFVHGLLMMKDGKMSKSRGNVVDPIPLINRYGVDAVRFYLARETYFGSDGTFTPEQFVERINVDLANDFGNLLNRSVSMIEKYFEGVIPVYEGQVTEFDADLEALASQTITNYMNYYDDLKVTDAVIEVFKLISATNKHIDNTKPWELSKEGKTKELASVMNHLANNLLIAGILLQPILVETPAKLFTQLGVDQKGISFDLLNKFGFLGGQKVNKGEPLFPRLNVKEEVEFIHNLMNKK